MNKIRYIIILFWALFAPSSGSSQNFDKGFTLSYGISKINATNERINYHRKINPFSFKLGLFYEKNTKSKSLFGFEILWIQIGGKLIRENVKLYEYSGRQVDSVGVATRTTYTHLSYFGFPIYYKYKLNNFGIRGGIQPMILFIGASNGKSVGEKNGQPYNKKNNLKIDGGLSFDIGFVLGVDYKLNHRYLLKMEYYYGIANLSGDSKRRLGNRQLSFGFNYLFK